jgi:hypothetical protein
MVVDSGTNSAISENDCTRSCEHILYIGYIFLNNKNPKWNAIESHLVEKQSFFTVSFSH